MHAPYFITRFFRGFIPSTACAKIIARVTKSDLKKVKQKAWQDVCILKCQFIRWKHPHCSELWNKEKTVDKTSKIFQLLYWFFKKQFAFFRTGFMLLSHMFPPKTVNTWGSFLEAFHTTSRLGSLHLNTSFSQIYKAALSIVLECSWRRIHDQLRTSYCLNF